MKGYETPLYSGFIGRSNFPYAVHDYRMPYSTRHAQYGIRNTENSNGQEIHCTCTCYFLPTADESTPHGYGSGGIDGRHSPVPPYALFSPTATAEEMDVNIDRSSIETDALSPQQYAMLMNSMKDPVAMYSSSLNERADAPLANRFDPLDMYSGHPYNTGGGNEAGREGENSGASGGRRRTGPGVSTEDDHPIFTMMSSSYQQKPTPHQPRPPAMEPHPPASLAKKTPSRLQV
jgi:hypothetical protein